ncbi:hypothetical protein, partial [Pseudomonas syringae]|uniref:hypothetical protein n=1 Tax=Pseudomonas syringae TaxID=317 RepID=UPI001F2B8AB3
NTASVVLLVVVGQLRGEGFFDIRIHVILLEIICQSFYFVRRMRGYLLIVLTFFIWFWSFKSSALWPNSEF